ncbi:hypothetical protein ACTA71_004290 [Dictyostelium dimigraforme]
MEPNITVNQSSSQQPFSLSNLKIVDNNHDADWLTKMNNPIEPAVIINNQSFSTGTVELITDTHPNGIDVKFNVKPCGSFVEYQQTLNITSPGYHTISKNTSFSKNIHADSKFKLGKRAYIPTDFEAKFKFIRKFEFSADFYAQSTTTYSQYLSTVSYVHQSLVTYAYKMVDSIDHRTLVQLNPDFGWKFIGNDLYFFISIYSNNQIIRPYDSKYQMINENDFINYLANNRNLWDN